MTALRFATPGTPLSTPSPGGTLKGLQQTAQLGIRAMEIEWVQRVPSNATHIAQIKSVASSLDIALTVHAPYFVNLHSKEPEKLEASIDRILSALRMAEVAGAVSVCVHAAFYGKDDPSMALDSVLRATERILKHRSEFPSVNLAYETMGKHSQFGTLSEVLQVSKAFGIYPCVDIAHMHARSNGGCNDASAWDLVFDEYASVLGKQALQRMHLHYSGIHYSDKGERCHLPLEESDAAWQAFAAYLKQKKIGGILVCESPVQEEDVLKLMKAYEMQA